MSPYIVWDGDIYHTENINTLLDDYPHIERRYYQLWISSINIMNSLINNDIVQRTNDLIVKTKNNQNIFVQCNHYYEWLEKLQNNNILLITWEPWVGKTTLANAFILYMYHYHTCEVIEMTNINDGEKLFSTNPESKQIFYFDDFLWANILEIIDGKNDAEIARFIERIQMNKNKFLILTSRLHIVNQWVSIGSRMDQSKIRNKEFFLEVKNLTDYEKGKILYNHLYHAKKTNLLTNDQIDYFFENQNYKKIISHKNFNPRIIQFITDSERLQSWDYSNFVINSLDNPAAIWEIPYSKQISDCGRYIVACLAYNRWEIRASDLRKLYDKIILNKESLSRGKQTFEDEIRHLSRSFITLEKRDYSEIYVLFNPSISDFILKKYKSELPFLLEIYEYLDTIESLEYIEKLHLRTSFEKDIFSKILLHLSNKNLQTEKYEYFLHVFNLLNEYFPSNSRAEEIWDFLIQTFFEIPNSSITSFITFFECIYEKGKIEVDHALFIIESLIDESSDDIELSLMVYDLVKNIWIEEDFFLNNIKENVKDIMSNEDFLLELCNENLRSNVIWYLDEHRTEYEYKWWYFEDDLCHELSNYIKQFSSKYIDPEEISLDVISSINTNFYYERVESIREDEKTEHDRDKHKDARRAAYDIKDIEDLFYWRIEL